MLKDEELNAYGSVSNGSPSSMDQRAVEQQHRWKPSVFDFKGGGTCPTCHGTGKIPRGQEDELVALIPYKDKRLKPRRTCLYVCAVVLPLLVTGGLLTAFLFPRDVKVYIPAMNSAENSWFSVWNPTSSNVAALEVETQVKIHNNNFFPVRVSTLNVTLSHMGMHTLGTFKYPRHVSVGTRDSKTVTVLQNATFQGTLAKQIVSICTEPDFDHYINMEASVLVGYTYLSHSSVAVDSAFHFLKCDIVSTEQDTVAVLPNRRLLRS